MPLHSSLLNKPRLVEKLKRFYDYVQKNDGKVGTKTRGIDLNLNNACNLRCKYCFTNSPKGEQAKARLPLDVLARVADEADELGYFEFDLQGGELLLRPDILFESLEAIKPERFYLYLTTNGYKLDQKMAQKLAKAHVSRVSVSVDSMNEKTHDEIRGRKDSWRKAIEALKHVQEAGMDPYLNITMGHYNAFDPAFEELLKYSKDNNYKTLINVAVPAGMWSQMDEIMLDDKDREHLNAMRKKYKNLVRNIWNPFDRENEKVIGCTTVNRLYITPLGDVLACPYVHIKVGNVIEQSLKEIVEFGFSIKHFSDHSPVCLAGENTEFVKNYMSNFGQTIFRPADAKKIFKNEDFLDKDKVKIAY